MDNCGIRKGRERQDGSVAHTCTQSNYQIALIQSKIGGSSAVASQHSVIISMICRYGAYAHHSGNYGNITHFRQLYKLVTSARNKNPAARTYKRSFTVFQSLSGLADLKLIAENAGLIGAYLYRLGIFKLYFLLLNVHRHIYKYGTRTA